MTRREQIIKHHPELIQDFVYLSKERKELTTAILENRLEYTEEELNRICFENQSFATLQEEKTAIKGLEKWMKKNQK